MVSRFRPIRMGIGFVVCLLAGTFHLFAQSASISGKVTDTRGAAVRRATISLMNTDTQVSVTTRSDERGAFILPPASPGHYQATVSADGFSTWEASAITLEVGAKQVLNAILTVGSVQSTVSVTRAAPELSTQPSDRGIVAESAL